MPIHKEGSGYQWGQHGKVYSTREGAVKQAMAAHANGYKEKGGGGFSHDQKMMIIAKAHKALASK